MLRNVTLEAWKRKTNKPENTYGKVKGRQERFWLCGLELVKHARLETTFPNVSLTLAG